MCPRSFLEVRIDSLDENGFGLSIAKELATAHEVELGLCMQLT